jgi:hypothetical protein
MTGKLIISTFLPTAPTKAMHRLRPQLRKFLTKPDEGKVDGHVMKDRYKDFFIKEGILTHDEFMGREADWSENRRVARTKGMPKDPFQMAKASKKIEKNKGAATPRRVRKPRASKELVFKDGSIQVQHPPPSARASERARDGSHRTLDSHNSQGQDVSLATLSTHRPSPVSPSQPSPPPSSTSVAPAAQHSPPHSTNHEKSQDESDKQVSLSPSRSQPASHPVSPAHHSDHLFDVHHETIWPHDRGFVYQPLPDSPRFSGDLGHLAHVAQHDTSQHDLWSSL